MVFGEAANALPYVKCDERGAECHAAKVEAYPTWKIGSNLYPGFKSPSDLLKLCTKASSQ